MKGLSFFFLTLILACGTKGPASQADLLPREKFRSVLLEAQILEARMNQELMVAHVAEVPADKHYEELFAEHSTTKAQFDSTFNFYAQQPEQLIEIYEEIITELSRRKDERK